jgi:WD40 repeat protein
MPEPALTIDKPNIFGVEQEQWLGDTQAERFETEYDLLPAADSVELDRIAQKLLAQLPSTQIHFQFRVYESSEANAFSVAGGYVYVSRKLITDARSEDELAGVLSHEIGHIYTHQVAIGYTRILKAELNVRSVTSREDVIEKVQLSLNAPEKDGANESEDEAEKDELVADRVGIYALIKAGYAPKAFSENLDRIANNKGHTGNFLTDLLGGTSEISRRVRVARKIAASLPASCASVQPGSSPEFKQFQQAVRESPIHAIIQATPGLNSFRLDPPMRSPLDAVEFSPNGQYILAQDESAVQVLSRKPLKVLFTIDAPNAGTARFSPDSSKIVLHYPSMRVERWDVAGGKRVGYQELVDYEGCSATSLSPDGRTFVCIANTWNGLGLKLIDVDSAQIFFEDKTFYPSQYVVDGGWARLTSSMRFADVAYSQDGRKMVIVVGAKAAAWDLEQRRQISLGKGFTQILQGRTAFVDSNKLVFDCERDYGNGGASTTYKVCESTFPEGLPINSFKLAYQWLQPVSHGSNVLIGPLSDNAAVLVDPSTGKANAAFKMDSLDAFDHTIASENEGGGVSVGDLGSAMLSIDLPETPLARLEAAGFSPDGRFLAFSTRSRSSIWDLKTKKRIALMRPFRAVRFDDQDRMYAQYPDSQQKPGQNYRIDLATGKSEVGAKYVTEQVRRGEVLVAILPLEKDGNIAQNVNMQAFDPVNGDPLWSKHFGHQTPAIRQTDGDDLLFLTDMTSQTATDETAHAGERMIKTSDTVKEWIQQGLLVEIVNSRTGDVLRKIESPQRSANQGQEDERRANLFGDYLVVHGNFNDSTIYRISDGARLGGFYGRCIAGDGNLGLIAATNRDQEVIILDAKTGNELKRITVDQRIDAARFIPTENALYVLTANQTVYSIGLPSSRVLTAAQ